MKNSLKYTLAAIMLIMAGSCTDWLDLKPQDQMVLDDYWKTRNDVESVVLACYRAMAEDGYMERIILGGELRSDNVIVEKERLQSTDDQITINDMTIKPTNGLLPWKDFYFVINLCNTVLEYAPVVIEEDPDYSIGFLRTHEAEVRTLRALAYFYLVRIYRDVPYIDFPYAEDTQEFNIPKTAGDEILELQIEELLVAERYALKTWGTNNTSNQKGRVTKNMVRALLADIYLWLGKYDECIEACNRILPDIIGDEEVINPDLATGAELRLITNRLYPANSFQQLFYIGNSMESIFELQFSSTVVNRKVPTLYGGILNIGQLATSEWITDYFKREEEDNNINDLRKWSYVERSNIFSQLFKYIGRTFTETVAGSYYEYSETSPFQANWIFYRLADVYLMKAEALVERNGADDLTEALDLVNITYMRSNPGGVRLSANDFTSWESMRDLVLLERQREFLFEGKRWFDLVRLARKEDRVNGTDNHPKMLELVANKYQYNGEVIKSKLRNTDALYLPIAEKELISNRALEQNPYYDDLTAK